MQHTTSHTLRVPIGTSYLEILALARSLGSLWEAFSGYEVQGRGCPGSFWETISGYKVQGGGYPGSLRESFSGCRVEGEGWPGRCLKVQGTGQWCGHRFSGCGVQGEVTVGHRFSGCKVKVCLPSRPHHCNMARLTEPLSAQVAFTLYPAS